MTISPSMQPLDMDEPKTLVQEYINSTLAGLVHELTLPPSEARLSVFLKRRANPARCIINSTTGALEAAPRVDAIRTYSWPGKTAYEAWKFSMTFCPPPCFIIGSQHADKCGCSSGASASRGYHRPSHSDETVDLQKVLEFTMH